MAHYTSRSQLIELGALRPVVGAVFGVIVQFALVGGLLGAVNGGRAPDGAFGLFALIGFIAGFSERFATDMIERAGQVIAGSPASAATEGTSAEEGEPDPGRSPTGTARKG